MWLDLVVSFSFAMLKLLTNAYPPSSSLFFSKTSEIVNFHVPLKRLSRREVRLKSRPTISLGIMTSIHYKNKLYRKFIKIRSQCTYAKYKVYRNQLNHLINIIKKQYYQKYFIFNKSNIKNIWR